MDDNKQRWTAKESIGFMLVLSIITGLSWFMGLVQGITAVACESTKDDTNK